jgi:hypothetical protein
MIENARPAPWRSRRRGFITAGALLCCLGLANWIVGGIRLAKYQDIAEKTRVPAKDPAVLSTGFTFSDVSEGQERHNIAVAKLQYYAVVLAAGQVLLAGGLLLVFIGYLRSLTAAGPPPSKTLLDSM